jgi:hypothetical protein
VYYKGNNTIIIGGEALDPLMHQISNEKFWKAIEILEHDFGCKLDKLVINGLGSEVSPERFYAVLTK